VQVLASAVVIVADWIASNDELFPYDTADERTAARLDAAWGNLGPRWGHDRAGGAVALEGQPCRDRGPAPAAGLDR
jgi:hypothetical protein